MAKHLDFNIQPSGPISIKFLGQGISTFADATTFVRTILYGRNTNKEDLTTLFDDHCGTCSTKHALLKLLADENNVDGLKLFTGLFRMNGINTPKIAATLKRHHLDYIPEAHNYLKWNRQILDFTNKNSQPSDFVNDLIEEMEIHPNQIGAFKVAYHQQYLAHWLEQQTTLQLSLAKLWTIREECIQDLSTHH